MKTLFVTGGSGFLGWKICRLCSRDWNVYGTVFSRPKTIPGVNTVRIDLTRFSDLKDILNRKRPDLLIHTAAASSPNFCQTHSSETHKINVTASINIAGLCADLSIPCIFTSSDLVFDGLNAPYDENDQVSPVNVYGQQKVLAEEGMLQRCPWVTICRLPLMFGRPGPGAVSFIQPMIEALRLGRELPLFVDEFRTPISAESAVQGIFAVHSKVPGKIVHLGGLDRVSRYGLGQLLADSLHLHNCRLIACRREDLIMPAPRPGDVSLCNATAVKLGFKPRPLKEELEELYSQL